MRRLAVLRPIVRDAWRGLRRNAAMTVAVVLCSAVALALLGAGLLLRQQVQVTSSFLYGRVELVMYLRDDITLNQRQALDQALTTDPAVAHVAYESKADNFAKYRELFRDQPDLLDNVGPELVPASFTVKLTDPHRFDEVADRYRGYSGVDDVSDWRKKLDSFFRWLHGFQLAAFAVAGVMGFATLVLLYNTIRMSAHSRRRETGIMRLVGATRLHIQLPFVLESAAAGLVGALVADAVLYGLFRSLVQGRFARNHFTPLVGGGQVGVVLGLLTLVGAGLSALLAFVALSRHLRAADPPRARVFRAARRSDAPHEAARVPRPRASAQEEQTLAGRHRS